MDLLGSLCVSISTHGGYCCISVQNGGPVEQRKCAIGLPHDAAVNPYSIMISKGIGRKRAGQWQAKRCGPLFRANHQNSISTWFSTALYAAPNAHFRAWGTTNSFLRRSDSAWSAQETSRKQNDCFDQREHTSHCDTHDAKRQQKQPNDRIQHQRQQGQRPTADKE